VLQTLLQLLTTMMMVVIMAMGSEMMGMV